MSNPQKGRVAARQRTGRGRSRRFRPATALFALVLAAAFAAASWANDIVVDLSTEAARTQTVQRLAERAEARKAAAIALAQERGWPIRGTMADGSVYELMKVVDGIAYYYITHNVNAAISTAAHVVRSTDPFNVQGDGMIVGVWDEGAVRPTHQEFLGRVVVMDGADNSNHGTHVGGTIGAAGVQPNAMGMAPSITIHTYDWDNDLAEMAAAAATGPGQDDRLPVSNHSYGLITGWYYHPMFGHMWFGWWEDREDRGFGQYSADAQDMDAVCYGAPYYLPFKAAGNDRNTTAPPAGTPYYRRDETWNWVQLTYDPLTGPYGDGWKDGGYNTISYDGVAKNIMTVGAVSAAVAAGERDPGAAAMSAFSGWGPADDGRVKPDIVACGVNVYSPTAGSDSSYLTYSGTSMASPNAAGSAMLLVEHYRNLFPGGDMRASTLKGLIIHTADDLGNPGPDYRFGWGLMNTEAAALHISDHHEHPDALFLVENFLDGSHATRTFKFFWNGEDPIRATLCWTDPPGPAQNGLNETTPVLVHDLDLRIVAPDGETTFFPYVLPYTLNPEDENWSDPATTGDNTLDNVEQVYIAAPGMTGAYTVEISHKGNLTNGEQWFSLILSGQDPEGQPQWTLSVQEPEGQGTTDPGPGQHGYSIEQPAVVTATPDAGWKLSHWILDGTPVGPEGDSITVPPGEEDQTKTLQAVFAEQTWTLSVMLPEGQGTTDLGVGEHVYSVLQDAVVSATPASGWKFGHWLLNGEEAGTGTSITVPAQGDGETATLQAVFKVRSWNLSIQEPVGQGATEPPTGDHAVPIGTPAVVSASPAEGWRLAMWWLDGEDVGPINPLTVEPAGEGVTRTLQAVYLQRGARIYVNRNATGANNGTTWEDAYTHLQPALDMAKPGDEIWVAAGIYMPIYDYGLAIGEKGRHFRLINDVAVYGGFAGDETELGQRDWEVNVTTLHGNDYFHVFFHPTLHLNATALLDGFTITGGNADSEDQEQHRCGGGMYNDRSSPTIRNCTFSGNKAVQWGGGMFNYRSSPTLINCSFSGNSSDAQILPSPPIVYMRGGGGMYNERSAPTILNCAFSGNSSRRGGGMYNFNNSNPSVVKSTFNANTASRDGAGMFNESSSPVVSESFFSVNTAVWQGGGMFNLGSHPAITNCTFSENATTNENVGHGGGMFNLVSSPTLTSTKFNENSAAVDGGGLYNENSFPSISECEFSMNSAQNDGGGMFNIQSTPHVSKTKFIGNWAGHDGGGMSNTGTPSPTVVHCTFSGNTAENNGGGMSNDDRSSTLVVNCTFDGNVAEWYGGGMSNYNLSSPTVRDTIFRDNVAATGGGMINHTNSSPIVRSCMFVNNWTTEQGGGMSNHNNSNPRVTNTVFSGNHAKNGGGFFCYTSTHELELINCTFVGNSATNLGGGVSSWYSSPSISNTIVWDNEAHEHIDVYFTPPETRPTFRHCNLRGSGGSGVGWNPNFGTDGGGNIDADPLFRDVEGGDLRLGIGSPSIDAGNNAFVPAVVTTDLDGNPRFVGASVDMGPYEFQGVWTLNILEPDPVNGVTDPPPGIYDHPVGTTPAVLANAYENWKLGHWLLDGEDVGDDNPIAVPSGADGQTRTLQPVFVRQTWTLRILEPEGEGTTDPAAGDYAVNVGDSAQAEAFPAADWKFDRWLLDGADGGDDNPITVPSGSDGQVVELQPVFVPQKWTLEILAPEGQGTTSPATGTHIYNVSQDAEVAASAEEQWKFSHWLLDGQHFGEDNPTAVPSGTFDGHVQELQAVFVPKVWTLHIEPPDGQGTTSPPTGSHEYSVADGADVQATAASGWRFSRWVLDGEDAGSANPIELPPLADGEERTLQAVFLERTGVLFVKHDAVGNNDGSSWEDAFTVLQDALDAAAAGEEIWVAAGTYRPTYDHGLDAGDRGRHFRLINNVALYGGFAGTEENLEDRDWKEHEAVLSGAIGDPDDPSDNAYHVFFHPQELGVDGTAILDGFTIAGGNADGPAEERQRGGGMFNTGASPTIANCVFTGNSATLDGGAMANVNSAPNLTNCAFVANAAPAGGAMANEGSAPTIRDCTFAGNEAQDEGGAVLNKDGSSPSIVDCAFDGNAAGQGGAIANRDGSNPPLRRSVFTGNTATALGGAIHNASSSPVLTNCAFFGNSAAGTGGALFNDSSNPTVANCAFSGNSAGENGGAMANNESAPALANTILWGNMADESGQEVHNQDSAPTFSYCNVAGSGGSGPDWDSALGADGGGNIDADPLFADAAEGDLRLLAGSPSIDAGSNALLPPGTTTDLDGNQRIVGASVDMGPYEFQEAWTLAIQPPDGSGHTVPGEGTHSHAVGKDAQVEAIPEEGWKLVQWLLDGENAGDDHLITVASGEDGQTKELKAVFERKVWTLSVLEPDGDGATAPAAGEYEFYVGIAASVEALPAEGMKLARWLLDGEDVGDETPITVASGEDGQTIELQAVFVPLAWTLSVLAPQGEGTTLPETGEHVYLVSESAEVLAVPEEDWRFNRWLLDGQHAGFANPITVPPGVDGQTKQLRAVFTPKTWTLTILEPEGQGTTEPLPGQYAYDVDTYVEVTALPAYGWELNHWLLDGENAGDSPTITVPPGDEAAMKELRAVFTLQPGMWLLSIEQPEGQGETDPTPGLYAHHVGESAAATAAPSEGWRLRHWLVDGVDFGNAPSVAVPPAQEGETRTLQAVFMEIPPIFFVKHDATGAGDGSSWDDAFTQLQPALDAAAAAAGGEIWVAAGTYYPTSNHGLVAGTGIEQERLKHFRMKNGVAIYGGFAGTEDALEERDWAANETVLSGAIGDPDDDADNAYHVFFHPEFPTLDATAVLDGFTVTRGNANAPSGILHRWGGGMHNRSSSPTVRNCTFAANSAHSGGGMANSSASPTIANSRFVENTATSGSGGGMFNNHSSAPEVKSSAFVGNSAFWGGGVANWNASSPALSNCAFFGNSAAQWGGAMTNRNASAPAAANCTFSGNEAPSGPAMACHSTGQAQPSTVTMVNTIVRDGEDWLWNNDNSQISIAYSNVQGGWAGEGNLDADPLFVDAEAGNLRLLPGSPCIDAGDSAALPEGLFTDRDGNPRVMGDAVDMGAYEFQGQFWTLALLGPEGSGTTEPTEGEYHFALGENAEVGAIPDEGWKLDRWILDGEDAGDDNLITVPARADRKTATLQAVFVRQTWTLSVLAPDGEGSTEPAEGDYVFNVGEDAQITATPAKNWKLIHWLLDGEGVGDDNPMTVVSGEDGQTKEIQAVFVHQTWTLSVLPPDGDGNTAPATGEHTFNVGDDAEVTATPAANWNFSHWLLDGEDAGTENPITVSSGTDGQTKELQAVFVRQTWTLSILEPDGQGATVPSAGIHLAYVGDEPEVAAIPAENWKWSHWLLDGVDAGTENPITVPSGTEGQTKELQAVFVRQTWTLSILEPDGQGATDPAHGDYEYNVGDDAPVAAIPDAAWRLGRWLLGGEDAGSASTLVVESAGDGETRTLQAAFVERTGLIYVRHDAVGANDGTSWADAYPLLQSGLDAATAGDEIWVAAGTYRPTSDYGLVAGDGVEQERLKHFRMKNGVALYGGFDGTEASRGQRDWAANETVLSGDIGVPGDMADNCYHVFYHPQGLGLDGTAVLDGFTITGGNADGPAEEHQSGGGMANRWASPTVVNCTFSGNAAGYGGGMANVNSSPLVANAVFRGNSASVSGGGLHNVSAAPTLANCTFSGNSAPVGSSLACDSTGQQNPSSVNIANTILWDGEGAIWNNDGSQINITHSNVQGGWPGEENIDADPMFVNAEAGNLRLRLGSPCIDAGESAALPDGLLNDLDGNPRIMGDAVDMGAYEFQDPFWTLAVLEPEGSGATVPSVGEYAFALDDDAEVEAIPDAGWKLDRWLIGGENAGDDNPITVPAGADREMKALQAVFVRQTWTLSVLPPEGDGWTDPAAGDYVFNVDEDATVMATPAENWKFSHWLLDGEHGGADIPLTVPAGADGETKELQPVFVRQTWTLSVLAPDGEGATNPATGSHVVNVGEGAEVSAMPEENWKLSYWLLDGEHAGSDNPIAVPTGADGQTKELQAVFVRQRWILTVIEPDGQGATNPGIGSHAVHVPEGIKVPAAPAENWKFSHWLLDGEHAGSDDPIAVPAAADGQTRVLQAVFVRQTWTLSVLEPEGEGSTSPAAGEHTVNVPESAQVSATPAENWKFSHWLLDGEHAGADIPVTVPAGADGETKEIQPVFVRQTWTLSVLAPEGEGSTNPATGSHVVNVGEGAVVSAMPEENWKLSYWLLDGEDAGSDDPIVVPTGADGQTKELQAVFVRQTWTLSVIEPEGQGATNPGAGSHVFNVPDAAEASATPAANWKFSHWLLDGEHAGSDDPIAVPAAADGQTRVLQAVFVRQTWTLSVLEPEGEGSTSPAAGEHTVNVPESAQVSATPAENWKFSHWILDGEHAGADIPVTVPAGADGETKELQAVFVRQTWTLGVLPPDGEGATEPGEGEHAYGVDEPAAVLATPAENWNFSHWLLGGEDIGEENPTEIAPGADGEEKALQAVFVRQEWTLSVLAPEGEGATEPGEGEHPQYVGDVAEVAATPAEHWKLSHWLLDGENAGSDNPLEVPSGTEGQVKELQAVFVQQTWTLRVLPPQGEGATEPAADEYVLNVDEDADVSAQPAEGRRLGVWHLDGENAGRNTLITVPAGADGQTKELQAVFEPFPVLYVAKSPGQEAANPGSTVAFAIEFGNYGPTDARGVVVREVLPEHARIVPDSATDDGIYDEDTRTITWHVGDLAAGTLGRTVGFQAVVDEALLPGDTVVNEEYTVECDDTDPLAGDPVEVEVVDDVEPPTASLDTPGPSRFFDVNVQVPRDTLIVVQVADAGCGVAFRTVKIRVNGDLVYDGAEETAEGEYASDYGTTRRAGSAASYRFFFARSTPFGFGREVVVEVEASDRAANEMKAKEFHFRTLERPFGQQFRVNAVPGNCGRAALARDPAGNLFAAWEQGGRVWASRLPVGTGEWTPRMPADPTRPRQMSPAVAGDGDALLVAWVDGHDDVFAALFKGGELAGGPFKMNRDAPAAAPAAAFHFPAAGTPRPYVAWQERRGGAWDVFVAWRWQNEWHVQRVTNHPDDQTQPALATDGEAVHLVWADARNGAGRTDIYAASSTGGWRNVEAMVDPRSSQRRPTLAVQSSPAGRVYHLAWEDDRNGVPDVFHASGATWPLDPASAANLVQDDDPAVLAAAQRSPALHAQGGYVFAAWQDERGGTGKPEVYFAEKGSGFSLPVLVKTSESAQSRPALASDRFGSPVLLWTEGSGAAANIAGAGGVHFQPVAPPRRATPGEPFFVGIGELGPSSPSIAVPRGALEAAVDISVSSVENPPPPPPNAIGVPWKFSPAGLRFSEPATIEIPVTPEDMAGRRRPYRVYWYDEELAAIGEDPWIPEEGIDADYIEAAGVIRFKVSHFTKFIPSGAPLTRRRSSSGACDMAGSAGAGDVALLLLPHLAALGLAIRHRRRKRQNAS